MGDVSQNTQWHAWHCVRGCSSSSRKRNPSMQLLGRGPRPECNAAPLCVALPIRHRKTVNACSVVLLCINSQSGGRSGASWISEYRATSSLWNGWMHEWAFPLFCHLHAFPPIIYSVTLCRVPLFFWGGASSFPCQLTDSHLRVKLRRQWFARQL